MGQSLAAAKKSSFFFMDALPYVCSVGYDPNEAIIVCMHACPHSLPQEIGPLWNGETQKKWHS